MVAAEPSYAGRAQGPLSADDIALLEEEFAGTPAGTSDGEQQEFELTQATHAMLSPDESTPNLTGVEGVSSVASDADLNVADVAKPQAAFNRSGEAPSQRPRVVRTVSTPRPWAPGTIREESAAQPSAQSHLAQAHPSGPSDPAMVLADQDAMPVESRSAQLSEPAGGKMIADQPQPETGAEASAPAQILPAELALPSEPTVKDPVRDSENQGAERIPISSDQVVEVFGSRPDEAQTQPESQQPSSLKKPVVATTTKSPRRGQIQEVRAEAKPQAALPIDKPARSSKSQRAQNPPKSTSAAPAASQPEAAAESQPLFAPRKDTDRSPAAWRERLAEAIRVERELASQEVAVPPAESADARANQSRPDKTDVLRRVDRPTDPSRHRVSAQPGRLPESARRFLSPLVGFDARDIPVHQGPAESRVLAASGADAMAAGESIVLGPGQDVGSAKTLGVLAHELTHIARGREARFVPPVARAATRESASLPDTTNEEGLARQVESRVTQAAEENAESAARGITVEAGRLASSPKMPLGVSPDFAAESWGGLPAPWEPMPEWVSAPQAPQLALVGPTQTIAAPVVSAPSAATASESASAAPALAETGRSLPDEAESPQETAAQVKPDEGKHAEPDLDALARQVYTIVRRRLAADRRREFMQ
jgi:hypothetical protein